MLSRPTLTRLLLGAGVGLQLIGFLALYNRFTQLIFGFMFVLFHYLNDIMFGLYFYHPEKMDWIFLINIPFWTYVLYRYSRRRPIDLEANALKTGTVG